MNTSKRVVVLGGARIPFVKSFAQYSGVTNPELMTFVLQKLVAKYKLQGKLLGDVALGCLLQNPKDWNMARESVLSSGLDPNTPAYNVQRACGTSLETALQISLKIAAGQIECGIAGGTDSNSDVPIAITRKAQNKLLNVNKAKSAIDKAKALLHLRPTDLLLDIPGIKEPRTGLSMGEHCELMVKEWKISREAQDELTYASHQNAVKAYKDGFFNDLVHEFKKVKQDTIVRADTTLERLAKLKPVFDRSASGTLTAGNSSSLSDGASAVLLSSEEWATKNQLPILADFVDAQSAAMDFVHGEGLLMAPTVAVSELLKRQGLTLQDFDFYEIHEAFAGQVLCTLKAWESEKFCREKLNREKPLGSIDRSKLNVAGGSVALGHPFAATGTRIVATLAKLLNQKGKGRGIISVCTAGGMGVAAILEKK